jgi:hypothetical protein
VKNQANGSRGADAPPPLYQCMARVILKAHVRVRQFFFTENRSQVKIFCSIVPMSVSHSIAILKNDVIYVKDS